MSPRSSRRSGSEIVAWPGQARASTQRSPDVALLGHVEPLGRSSRALPSSSAVPPLEPGLQATLETYPNCWIQLNEIRSAVIDELKEMIYDWGRRDLSVVRGVAKSSRSTPTTGPNRCLRSQCSSNCSDRPVTKNAAHRRARPYKPSSTQMLSSRLETGG